ncbi:MAG: hypothetical protein CVV11_20030 [Gammaproteobacteria bacterium HGW-Gammaproteobacteria-15]|nr:MAG: hypothetical protein CVV11_20030 [Gammaproteobacteria bacterium HGW-Gammaproteobacteria-15]
MKTPQILTGQQAIDQFGLNALIECRVAVTTELNGLGHSVMQIGVIADPDSCQIDEDDTGVMWVEYEGADDWYLYSIPADEQFVLLDDKNPQESNAVLSERIADLTRKNSGLQAQVSRLRKALKFFADDELLDIEAVSFANDVLNETPAQCLAEHNVEVVDSFDAFIEMMFPQEGVNFDTYLACLDMFKDQLRQQAKVGN